MSDVRRLVGIDAGVLDQNLAAHVGSAFTGMVRRSRNFAACQGLGRDIALQPRINVARSGDFKFFEALRQRQLGDKFFGDLARRLAQTLGQFEREGQGELTHLNIGRLVDDDVRQLNVIFCAQERADVAGQVFLLFKVHLAFSS